LVYRHTVPEFLMQAPAGAYSSFEDELEALAVLDERTAGLGFLRLLWDHGGERDDELLRDPAVRTAALGQAAHLGVDAKLARAVFDDPKGLLRSFAELLAAYWESAFEDEWERLEPLLARTVSDAGARIAEAGVYAYLKGLSPSLLIDGRARELRRKVPHEHLVAIEPENQLVLVPSFYVWPHVRVNCDAPWPPGIVYPAPFAVAESRPGVPADELVHVLRALGDPTRLRTLKLIADRPRTTQELAPLVGISEAGLSKHLRLLARAGVVESHREGYYVVYTLAPDRIAPLSEALLRFLAS
jgi:DNA-binding transcriptional ArsR family regulator